MADSVDIYPPSPPTSVDVYPPQAPTTVEVYGGARGPKGDKGDSGTVSDAQVANAVNTYLSNNPVAPQAFEYDQPVASSAWLITHNLHFNPQVSVMDTAGTFIEPGTVDYVDSNHLTIHFNAAFSGTAYLS